jgi:cytosine/creatinine deaminase
MAEQFDILIKQAQLRHQGGKLFEIGIKDGKIAEISEKTGKSGKLELDARKKLVTESYVNTHLHLCKVYTLMMMDEEALKDYHGSDMGKAMTAIELAARVKDHYDEKWIIKNVRKAVAQAAIYGNTHIRAFADVDSKAKLEGVKALIKAREEFKGIVDIQVVAFAQDGIVREPGATELMDQAMKLGADVSGGIPWIEYTDDAIKEHVRVVFDLAKKYNKDVSMLVDDAGDPGLRSIEAMALEAIRIGWEGRALAHHARAMALYPTPYLQKLSAILKKARMGMVTDPQTGPLHLRVREMLENGNLVCLGQDDISDAYYPYGRNNMLEVGFLASHLLWFTTASDMETLYDMITFNAAKCMNVHDYGVEVGKQANLVVLDQPNILEAFRFHEAPAYVISHGQLVDREKMKQIAFPD